MPDYQERRSGRDRRDWDVFVYPDRRSGRERRTGKDRRQSDQPYGGPERRHVEREDAPPVEMWSTPSGPIPLQEHYSTAEVANATGLTQTTLLLWIRNKVIDGSRIRRSREGRRLWTREDIEAIQRVKSDNGWI